MVDWVLGYSQTCHTKQYSVFVIQKETGDVSYKKDMIWYSGFPADRKNREKWENGVPAGNNVKVTQNRGKKRDYPSIGKAWIYFKW